MTAILFLCFFLFLAVGVPVVGSIGLVTVAPFTALCAGLLLTGAFFPGKVVDKSGN